MMQFFTRMILPLCVLVFFIPSFSTASEPAAIPVINTVMPNNTTIARLNKLELTIDITAAYTNPYDYDDIQLYAVFNTPNGRRDTVDGFFMQDYTAGTNGNLTAVGTGTFKIRYAPVDTGAYSYTVFCRNSGGTGQSGSQFFQCSASAEPGFIRKNSSNYLSFDNGNQYIPVGENMGWQNSNVITDYTTWVDSLAANGGNFIRVWMSNWAFALEWKNNSNGFSGLKKYKQTSAFYFDWLLDYSRQHNVYVMATLNNHGQVSTGVNPEWADNPYNAANGGPATNTWDFFTDATAKNLHKNRLRYIVARYGWSQSIQSWELFNEVDWTDQFDTRKAAVKNWHEEMANYLKSIDVNKHLVSTSYAKDANDPELWNVPAIDFSQVHYYVDAPNIENSIAAGVQRYLSDFNKPVFDGEFGLGPDGAALTARDPAGIHIHNALWGTAFCGAMGAGMSWWWDSYIHPRSLYRHFKPLASVLNGISFVDDQYKKTGASISGGGVADASIVPGADWGIAGSNTFTVDATGAINPAASQLSKYLYGNVYNTQYRMPPSFTVQYPVAGLFKVVTGGSTGTSPKMNIYVDGVMQLNVAASINSTYSVNVGAGTHTIKVDNLGTDWILISNYVFTNIGSPLTAYVLKSASNYRVAGYILNNNYNWQYLQNSGGTAPAAVSGASLQLTGLQNSNYRVEFYSCNTGAFLNSVTVAVSAGTLNVPLPAVAWDLAFKLSPGTYIFTGNGSYTNPTNWKNNAAPPATLPAGAEIIIDPLLTGSCILDVSQVIAPGASLKVMKNKKLVVNGNLVIQ